MTTDAEMRVGLRLTYTREVSAADCAAMSAVSEDRAGLHVDADYARRAGFPDAIAPGLIPLSVIAKLSGDLNLLLRRIELDLLQPAFAGDRLTATLTVTAWDAAKRRMAADGRVENQQGTAVMTGKLVGYLPDPAWGTPNKDT
jgi:acyl dehydratase